MRLSRRADLTARLVALGLLLTVAFVRGVPEVAATSPTSCTSTMEPFTVTQAIWGTTSSQSVYPGDQDVPLTVTLLFSGPCSAPKATFMLNLAESTDPVPFTGPNGATQPDQVSFGLSVNAFVTETFDLNVNQSATAGIVYHIPMIIEYDNNTASDVVSQFTTVPIALYGPVDLVYSASTSSLTAGATDDVTISIANLGTGSSGPVSTAITAPQGVTLLSQLAATGPLAPGGVTTQMLELYVSPSLAGAGFALTLTSKYLDQYSLNQTTTQTLGFQAVSAHEPEFEISVTPDTLVPGEWNSVVAKLSNEGPGTASSIDLIPSAPAGFSVADGLSGIGSLPAGQSGDENLSVFAPSSAAGTGVSLGFAVSFLDANGNSQSTTLTYGLQVDNSSEATSPILSYKTSDYLLVPGEDNTIPVTLSNLGLSQATGVDTQVTFSSAGAVVLAQLPFFATVGPGSSVTGNLTVFVPLGLAGSSLTLSVSSTFTYSDGSTGTSTQSLGFAVKPDPSASDISLSVQPLLDSVTTGTTSAVSFELKNIGNSTIYSPSYTITATQPLVVSENSTFSAIGTSIAPGQSQVFTAELTASPGSTAGIYQADLDVGYMDQYGSAQSKNFSVSVQLSGSVDLLVQDEQVTQNATALTVTGNLLNEGSSTAYYSDVSGSLDGPNATSKPDYVGEVDVNTPVPFSVTIPYRAPAAPAQLNLTLEISYKNGLGQAQNSSSSTPTHISAASSLPGTTTQQGPTGSGGPSLVELALVAISVVVIAATAVAGVVVRRRRAPTKAEGKVS